MLSRLRGLAQPFVRAAVRLGRGMRETYETLVETGLSYIEDKFRIDWDIYNQQKAFLEIAGGLDKDQLIPGAIHGKSEWNLTTKFKYDVQATYEDLKGNVITKYWSVISNERLTQNEVLDYAAQFAHDYAPKEAPYHAEPRLAGIWVRA